MAKTYTGNLSLEWYNKQKAILVSDTEADSPHEIQRISARINWVNRDESLFYEIIDEEGRGLAPYWVNMNDIRVKEARPLILQKVFKAIQKDKVGTIPGTVTELEIKESESEDNTVPNILIKGDNLLALNSLKKIFENKPQEEKIKCAYLDVPYNTDSAFEHYDDSLEHSEWLTMIRDRMIIIHQLLREDGSIFVHLDDKEVAYCKVLLDEIFGRQNYCNDIILSTNAAFGFKSTSDSLFKQANHILFYAKRRDLFNLKKVFIEKGYDVAYRFIFKDISIPESQWSWCTIQEDFLTSMGYSDIKQALLKMSETEFQSELALHAIKNSERVFRTAAVSGGALLKRQATIEKSKKERNKVIRHPNDDMDYIFINGERVLFYKERLIEIDGQKLPGEVITDIWTDISIEGIAKEGGVDFPKSKKPEKLVQRIFEIATDEGDYILDAFGGSGTSFAVALKMKRNWIGIEAGKHADLLIVPRLKRVIGGQDQSGISKSVNWQGGGSFRYYHLGSSIIKINKDGTGDFNWSLGKKFLEESFLLSYDYTIDRTVDLESDKLFPDKTNLPVIGVQKIGLKNRVAIISLNEPKGKLGNITYEELQSLYKIVKKSFAPEYINVFTNRGVEIAFDSKPDDLEVIKVPSAIFAELEK